MTEDTYRHEYMVDVEFEKLPTDLGTPPGQPCPACQRRVPYPKTAKSPKTKTVSLRIPIDDVPTFEETLEAAARNVDLYENPHWRYWTVQRGLVRVLQEPPGGEE